MAHIAYLSGTYLPSRKANAVHIMKMCSGFAAAGHEVTLVAGGLERDADPFEYFGVQPNFRITGPKSQLLPALAAGINLTSLAGLKPDVWYARSRSLAPFASGTDTPVVFEAHELPRRKRDRLREALVFRAGAPRRLVTISQALMDDYMEEFGSMLRRASRVVAHDAADCPTRPSQRPAWGAGAPRVGYVGSLYPGKGLETIISLAELRQQYVFDIVGGTIDEIAWWRDRGAPANVHFHGHVPHSELACFFSSFHVALLPILPNVSVDFRNSDIGRWTSPLKLFEYMAHDLPIIASDRPTIREVLTDGETGFLVPPGDTTAWARTLDRALEDYPTSLSVGKRAGALLREKYTWKVRAQLVLSGLL